MARVNLPPLINQLLNPAVYPHPVERVELVQTHISFVLLAGDFVYKIKKPVNFGFLDYSTLAKRRYYCRQEMLLNRRFCADIYLDVLPIRESNGRYRLGGTQGKVTEYAVKMRRLPLERRLDTLLTRGEATHGMLEALATRLAGFHEAAETTAAISSIGERGIRQAWRENFEQWAPYIGRTLTAEQDDLLHRYTGSFFRRQRELLRRRAAEGRIRDCHGDLRSDSICFREHDVCIFDCIEFNRRFRYTDIAGDVGFLAMDLDYRGYPQMAETFVRQYVAASGDSGLLEVLGFYKCYRAAVRAKVEGFRIDQPETGERERRRAIAAARRYFDLACRYARRDTPALIVMHGLSGSGKSTIARALASGLGIEVVASDVVRKQLAGIAPAERRLEPVNRGIYSAAFTDKTYRAALRAALASLRAGRTVLLDATFLKRKHRQWAQTLARKQDTPFLCLEVRAREQAVRKRLDQRLNEALDPSDARWEIYVAQKRTREPLEELPANERLALDSEQPLGELVERVRRKLRTP